MVLLLAKTSKLSYYSKKNKNHTFSGLSFDNIFLIFGIIIRIFFFLHFPIGRGLKSCQAAVSNGLRLT